MPAQECGCLAFVAVAELAAAQGISQQEARAAGVDRTFGAKALTCQLRTLVGWGGSVGLERLAWAWPPHGAVGAWTFRRGLGRRVELLCMEF